MSSKFPVPRSKRAIWPRVALLVVLAWSSACAPHPSTRERMPASVGPVPARDTGTLELGTGNSAARRVSPISIPMRDGVILRGYLLLHPAPPPFPVIVYRTPYDVKSAVESSVMFKKA